VKKRTVTTIETHQIEIIRRREDARVGWCPTCGKEVEIVPPEEAVLLTGVNLPARGRLVGAADIHDVESMNGATICPNPLPHKVALLESGLNSDGADTPLLASADPHDADDEQAHQ
jgi:hypothetical protein